MKYYSGTYMLELEMTIEQARSASHQGQCDADVLALSRVPDIAKQLAALDSEKLRKELAEYGAWDDAQLQDHNENLQRFLWCAAGEIVEEAHQWMTAVREHAKAHANYDSGAGGWDILIECWEDADIYDAMEGCDSEEEAIEAIGERLAISHEVRRDIEAERF